MPSGKWRPFCLGFNVLKGTLRYTYIFQQCGGIGSRNPSPWKTVVRFPYIISAIAIGGLVTQGAREPSQYKDAVLPV